jgi:hypothetical protein
MRKQLTDSGFDVVTDSQMRFKPSGETRAKLLASSVNGGMHLR